MSMPRNTVPATAQTQNAQAWQAARRVLAVRLDSLGDLLMTGPALRALKEQGEGRTLTLLTSPAGAQAAQLLPFVDDVIVHRAPWMKPEPDGPGLSTHLELLEGLQARQFDAAVIFTVFSQSPLPAALTLYLAGIPLRLAYSRENPYHLLSDWAAETEPQEGIGHEVERHLRLVSQVGVTWNSDRLVATPRPGARRSVARLLNRLGLLNRDDWYVLHPGATASSRRYPPELYARAVRELAGRYGLTPLFTGSEEERELTGRVRRQANGAGIDLAGKLDLHELTALIERAPLLITNNTGPAHIAAGTGTPVVSLYALTNPQHTPWRISAQILNYDVPCRNCFKSICPEGHQLCLRGVAPGRIVGAAAQLLGREPLEGEVKASAAAS